MDPFDASVLPALNAHLKCLTLFYHTRLNADGKIIRKIGFMHGDEIVSYIDLDAIYDGYLLISYSATKKYQNRKLNTCLRLFAGMIASKVGVGLKSQAINPISLYTMAKWFDCNIRYEGKSVNPKDVFHSYQEYIDFMKEEEDAEDEYKTILVKTAVPDYQACHDNLIRLLQEIPCVLGGKSKKLLHHKSKYTKHRKSTMV